MRPSAPPPGRACGAKTRDGDPCKNWGMRPSGRCRMHGGRSLVGVASPAYRHGLYSDYLPIKTLVRVWRWEEARRAETAARVAALIAADAAAWAAREERRTRRDAAAWAAMDAEALLDFAWMFEPADG